MADGLKGVASTNGGNFISLTAAAPAPAAPPADNLHLYWDSVTGFRLAALLTAIYAP